MSDLSKEERAAQAKKNRQASIARAREARAIKGTSAAAESTMISSAPSVDALWFQTFLVVLRNRDVKASGGVKDAIQVTDAIMDALVEAGKI